MRLRLGKACMGVRQRGADGSCGQNHRHLMIRTVTGGRELHGLTRSAPRDAESNEGREGGDRGIPTIS